MWIVRIDKPPHARIIIPTLEIIQICIGIVVIATISKGINRCNSGGILRYGTNAPSIVGISRNGLSVLVNDSNNVTLQVLDEIIRGVVIKNTTNTFLIIVDRNKRTGSPRFTQDFCTLKSIGVLYAPYCLARSDTIRIVGI